MNFSIGYVICVYVMSDGFINDTINHIMTKGTGFMFIISIIIISSPGLLFILICSLITKRHQYYRALVKTWGQISKGHIGVSSSEVYLLNKTPLPEWDASLQGMLHSFQRVAKGLVKT